MSARHIRVIGVLAAAAIVVTSGLLATSAQADDISNASPTASPALSATDLPPIDSSPFSGSSLTLDCGSLRDGYYRSAQVTTSATSWLSPNTAYQLGTGAGYPFGGTAPTSPVDFVTDANGHATITATITGTFQSGGGYALSAWQAGVNRGEGGVTASTCPSGVTASGTATAALDCPVRYLTPQGEGATAVVLSVDLQGFVAGQQYTVAFVNTTAALGSTGTTTAAADGSLRYRMSVKPSSLLTSGTYTWKVTTTSQAAVLTGGTAPTTDPCPPIVKAPKRAALLHDSDVTGDGYGDLLATDLNGRLLLYTNGIRSNPGGVPFSSARVIGTGWGFGWGMRLLATGDLTGDGVAEVVALRSDGTLVAYYNNIGSSAARLPYSSGTLIGSGWQSFTAFALGDVDGDGYADIVADRSDGTRWLYKNRFATDPLHRPFSTGVRIAGDGLTTDPSGNGIGLADFNGDGYADLTPAVQGIDLDRIPAGNTNPYPAPLTLESPTLITAQLAEWSMGDYEGRGSSGIVIANTRTDGRLIYMKDPLTANWQTTVIGSGWTWGMTLIP